MNAIRQLSIIGAIFLSSIGLKADPAALALSHTNQLSAASSTNEVPAHKLRWRLDQDSANLYDLLKPEPSDLDSPTTGSGSSTVTSYQLLALPQVHGDAVQFSSPGAQDAERVDPNEVSFSRPDFAFSPAAAIQAVSEPSDSFDSPADRNSRSSVPQRPSRRAETYNAADAFAAHPAREGGPDDGVPFGAPARAAVLPRVITPEPNSFVLFAIFAGVVWVVSSRRSRAAS